MNRRNAFHSAAVLLAHSPLSFFGAARFYTGKNGTGLLKILLSSINILTIGVCYITINNNELQMVFIIIFVILTLVNLIWYYSDFMNLAYDNTLDKTGENLKYHDKRVPAIFYWLLITSGATGLHNYYMRQTIRGLIESCLFVLVIVTAAAMFLITPGAGRNIMLIACAVLTLGLVIMVLFDFVSALTGYYPQTGFVFEEEPVKSRVSGLILNLFGGFLGFDRFYLGYKISGFIKLLSIGGIIIFQLIDMILLYAGWMKDSEGQQLLNS